MKIRIIALDKKTFGKSNKLLQKYDKLTIFDSVHAAFVLSRKEEILSTDFVFDSINGIKRIDPREL